MLAIRAVAQKDVETAEDNYRKAKAEVARAKQKASLLRVGADSVSQGYVLTSLIDGEVVNRSISPGMEVQGQYSGGTAAELFTVGETNPVWVLADAYEMDLARIHVGAKVHIKVVAFAEPFDGTVDWVSASLDPQTRTAKVRCTVKNPDHKLRPEMFATATIETDGRSALAIPRRAVVHLGDQAVVFVQRGDTNDGKLRFERVPVTVDEDEVGHLVAVQHGLAPGDVIVVSGAILLAG
jgi:cobalt-zinc-cadmium efflux system membrane fusion protein